jgi:hypothetical protein
LNFKEKTGLIKKISRVIICASPLLLIAKTAEIPIDVGAFPRTSKNQGLATANVTAAGVINMLVAIRLSALGARFYQAAASKSSPTTSPRSSSKRPASCA